MELNVQTKKVYAYTGGKNFDPKLPAVVFIHGGEQDHSAWVLQSRYLAHHGFGVLAVDLPGHGRSQGAALARIASGDIVEVTTMLTSNILTSGGGAGRPISSSSISSLLIEPPRILGVCLFSFVDILP